MDNQAKRTMIAFSLCLLIMVGWFKLMEVMYPPVKAPQNQATTQSGAPSPDTGLAQTEDSASQPSGEVPKIASAPPASNAPAAQWSISSAVDSSTVALGDDNASEDNPYEMKVVITPRGAGVESITLARHRNHVAKDRKNPDVDPYPLLSPVVDAKTDRSSESFVLEHVKIRKNKETTLGELDVSAGMWQVEKSQTDEGQQAVLSTFITDEGRSAFRLSRVYELDKHAYHLAIRTQIENLTDQPRELILTVRGPVGIKNDDPQREFRRIVSAIVEPTGKITDGQHAMRSDVFKSEGAEMELLPGEGEHTLWTALGSKYFACIVCPLPTDKAKQAWPDALVKVTGKTLFDDPSAVDDLTFEQVLSTGTIAPGAKVTLVADAFCGPKSSKLWASMPQAAERHYDIAQHVDQSGCTFRVITVGMLWLLTKLYGVVGNYGIAIIILVVIVRTILHPITKRGQVNMMKMQKSMGSIKPKIEAIQQQYKNDKQKLNEETMKLYREEGVNPAGSILGCLPMFLQMPIWVALWTTLNTNVDMRHQPFFFWINDLSSPDALIPFNTSFHIPLLGAMTGPITGFNLLPIIMTITMYAQQKFMQKLTKPAVPAAPKLDEHGNPVPDPMAQQQKMMNIMSIFFGFLFYNFPSGLNLYILSSNLLGMAEQYRIKKHIREKDERGDFELKKRPPDEGRADDRGGSGGANGKPPGLLERLAKKAEEARQLQSSRREAQTKKRKKQPRF
ncbi:hypothetical protein B7486_20140 [cyanobacterium TDX16]|nr:hypothetical protein B7486_20140 [cyanobacterium TDX16]